MLVEVRIQMFFFLGKIWECYLKKMDNKSIVVRLIDIVVPTPNQQELHILHREKYIEDDESKTMS